MFLKCCSFYQDNYYRTLYNILLWIVIIFSIFLIKHLSILLVILLCTPQFYSCCFLINLLLFFCSYISCFLGITWLLYNINFFHCLTQKIKQCLYMTIPHCNLYSVQGYFWYFCLDFFFFSHQACWAYVTVWGKNSWALPLMPPLLFRWASARLNSGVLILLVNYI